jgi:hypothetical protein
MKQTIGDKDERQHMYVVTDFDGVPRACCYNEVDADTLAGIFNNDAKWVKVPVACFHNSRNNG